MDYSFHYEENFEGMGFYDGKMTPPWIGVSTAISGSENPINVAQTVDARASVTQNSDGTTCYCPDIAISFKAIFGVDATITFGINF